jgi:SAM-dependent methyltransferase
MTELDAEHIIALARGFYEPRLMLTAVELDLFTTLSGKWLTVEQLAIPLRWEPRALRIVLDALVVMGLLAKHNGTYSTTTLSAEYLSRNGAFSILDTALHGVTLWHKWSRLTERVVGDGQLSKHDSVRAFLGAMHRLSPQLAPGIAALVRPELSRRFLDVGGGTGAYTMAFLDRDRTLTATIFDWPEVLPICADYLRTEEFEDRVRLVAGDFTRDEFPGQQGMVFLSAIVHQLSLERVRELLERAYRALIPGGRVVIRDYIMSPDRLQPREGTMFAVNTLVTTEGGDVHTFLELRESLYSAGFIEVRLLQDGERMNSVLEAYRPRG